MYGDVRGMYGPAGRFFRLYLAMGFCLFAAGTHAKRMHCARPAILMEHSGAPFHGEVDRWARRSPRQLPDLDHPAIE